MSEDGFEVVRGSGNVFRDFDRSDADIRQAKAILAAAILKTLDTQAWTTRKAEAMTGVDQADFSRIRRAHIGRFSIERLASILDALGQEVELSIRVRPRELQPDDLTMAQAGT